MRLLLFFSLLQCILQSKCNEATVDGRFWKSDETSVSTRETASIGDAGQFAILLRWHEETNKAQSSSFAVSCGPASGNSMFH